MASTPCGLHPIVEVWLIVLVSDPLLLTMG